MKPARVRWGRRILAALIPALLAVGLLAAAPAQAGHGGLIHGTQRWRIDHSTFGPHLYEAFANISVEESDTGASVRFRLSTECWKDGAHTACNHAANNAVLNWKNCSASSSCFGSGNYGDYGYRDFGTFESGSWYGLVTGGWHSDVHKSYWSNDLNVRVRYLDVDYLTTSVNVCSSWTEPDDYGDWFPGSACSTA